MAKDWASLPEKKLQALVQSIQKAKGGYKKMAAVEKVSGHEERHSLLWHLVRTGAVDGAADPELWDELNNGDDNASSQDVFNLLSKMTAKVVKKCTSADFIKGWPILLDQLAASAYDKDPALWDKGQSKLPKGFRDGLSILRARLGKPISSPAEAARLRRVIADTHVHGGLHEGFWMHENGKAKWTVIYTDRKPNAEFDRFVGLFGTKNEWNQTLLEAFFAQDSYSLSIDHMSEVVRLASREQAAALLARVPLHNTWVNDTFRFVRELRDDSPADMLWIAGQVAAQRPYFAEIAAVAALLKLEAAGQPADASAIPFIHFSGYYTNAGDNMLQGVDELVEALRTLPEEDRRKLLADKMDEPYGKTASIPALAALPEPALLDKALTALSAVEPKTFPAMDVAAYGFARLGDQGLSWLAQKIDEAKDTAVRETLVRAVLYTLEKKVRAGEAIDPAHDRFITFHGWDDPTLHDHYYGYYVRPALLEIVKALPAERAEAILLGEIDPQKRSFTRPFQALSASTPRALDHAFTVLGASVKSISQPSEDYLAQAIRALGDTALPHLQKALTASGSDPALLKPFESALGEEKLKAFLDSMGSSARKETVAETIARLGEGIPGPTTRIYVLELDDAPPAEGAISRVDGWPIGVDDESWPKSKEGKRFAHLFTLDLDKMPELQEIARARAIALFVSDRMNNSAWEAGTSDTQVLRLSDVDLQKGVAPADPDEDEGDHHEARGLTISPVDVPLRAFERSRDPDDEDEDEDGVRQRDTVDPARLSELRTTIYRLSARAGGPPIWLQGDDYGDDNFLLQFDEGLTSVNLGDCGIMYVFASDAFWQCH